MQKSSPVAETRHFVPAVRHLIDLHVTETILVIDPDQDWDVTKTCCDFLSASPLLEGSDYATLGTRYQAMLGDKPRHILETEQMTAMIEMIDFYYEFSTMCGRGIRLAQKMAGDPGAATLKNWSAEAAEFERLRHKAGESAMLLEGVVIRGQQRARALLN